MKYLRIVSFVALSLFFGYWLVQLALAIWDKNSKTAVWSFIPADAVAVFQIHDLVNTYQTADSTLFGQNFRTTPALQTYAQRAKLLAVLQGEGIDLNQYFKDKPLTISLHRTAKGNFDFAFFAPVTLRQHLLFKQILQNLITRHEGIVEKRNYQGVEIQEVRLKDNSQLFSYLIHKGYFVGSFTSFLVEETIRNFNELGRSNFYTTNQAVFDLPRPTKQTSPPALTCHYNPDLFANFLSVFYQENYQTILQTLQTQPKGYFELQNLQAVGSPNKKANSLLFSGLQLSFAENQKATNEKENNPKQTPNFLAAFPAIDEDENQLSTTTTSSLFQFIPRKTAYFYRLDLGTSKKTFFDNLQTIFSLKSDSLLHGENLDFFTWQSYMDGEVAMTEGESFSSNYADKLVFIKINEPAALDKRLQLWAKELIKNPKDTLTYENFGKQKIIQLPFAELPYKLFGYQAFAGFPQTYFTFINNYLVIGNTSKALIACLEDIGNGQVWAKMYQSSAFLEVAKQPAHLTQIVSPLRAWSSYTPALKPEWQSKAEENKRNLLRIEWLFLQQTVQENYISTTTGFFHEIPRTPLVASNQTLPTTIGNTAQNQTGNSTENSALAHTTARQVYATNFYNTLTSKPLLLLHPTDQSKEIAVQDAGNHVHLLGVGGKKLWHFPLQSSPTEFTVCQLWTGSVVQYLVASQNKLYWIDRNGKPTATSPLELKDLGTINFLTVFDYENTQNYRIVAADAEGNVMMLSKNGQILQGWSPKKLSGELASPPRHLRVAGKDALLLVEKKGIINLFKRNGELYAGFPVYVGAGLQSNFFVQQGVDFQQTILHLQTTQGEIIRINLQGRVVNREEMERPSAQSLCLLVPDAAAQQDYLLCRQDEKKLTIFSRNLTSLFSKEYDNASPKKVQYFHFGVHAALVAVTDTEQKKTYLYYKNGDSLTEPLASEQEILAFYNENKNEYLIYKVLQKEVAALRIWRN